MPEVLLSPEIWAAFLTLTLLEIVLGIDNIVFISILTNKLPEHQRRQGRILGLGAALLTRLLLLLTLSWMIGLTATLFEVAGHPFSGRDLILLTGGLFLLFKGVREIHNSLEIIDERPSNSARKTATFGSVIVQIALIDIVFSVDSVITAVGLVNVVGVMVAAIVIAVIVMMLAAGPISRFVDENPPIKMLALCFIVMIGFTLMIEGWGYHVPKPYIYIAMAFSFGVQMLNIVLSRRRKVPLRKAQFGDLYYSTATPDNGST